MNTLDFVMFDPVKAGEEWAVDLGSDHKVVECMIDGRPLIDIIHEYESGQKEKVEGLDYGHRQPSALYGDLQSARMHDMYSNTDEVDLFVCSSCGELGCNSVTCRVREDADYVYWVNFENGYLYAGLMFQFEKAQYDQAIAKLGRLAQNEQRMEYVRWVDRH